MLPQKLLSSEFGNNSAGRIINILSIFDCSTVKYLLQSLGIVKENANSAEMV